MYRSMRAVGIIPPTPYQVTLAAALPAERCVLARWGWAGEKHELFEHPAGGGPFCSMCADPRSSPTTKQVFRSRTVQELLGCSDVRTTKIYTPVLSCVPAGAQSTVRIVCFLKEVVLCGSA